MAFIKRKVDKQKASEATDPARELADQLSVLRQRRAELAGRLDAVVDRLDGLTRAHGERLSDGDVAALLPATADLVTTRSLRIEFSNALMQIDREIADVEVKLASEQVLADRRQKAAQLDGRRRAVEAAYAAFVEPAQRLADALRACDAHRNISTDATVAARLLSDVAAQIEATLPSVCAEMNAGAVELRRPPAQPRTEAAPPAEPASSAALSRPWRGPAGIFELPIPRRGVFGAP